MNNAPLFTRNGTLRPNAEVCGKTAREELLDVNTSYAAISAELILFLLGCRCVLSTIPANIPPNL